MKNLKEIAAKTREGKTPLYYSIAERAVYSEPGPGRYYLTELIRPNTEEEIRNTVKKFLAM